jgi:hypothetical protein
MLQNSPTKQMLCRTGVKTATAEFQNFVTQTPYLYP